MSEIQENTEAKLAAYIDGELEGAERAEIEKLLELNPNYRRMIDQLRITRDLLRGLPRESAPAELNEAFNGQLERSVLLEGVDNRSGSRTIHRWPQWAAVAAIVLLTIGLGAVVYFVLPKSRPLLHVAENRPQLQLEGEAPQQPAEDNADREMQRRDLLAETPGVLAQRQAGGNGAAASAPTVLADVTGAQNLARNVYESPQLQELLADKNLAKPANGAFNAGARADNPEDALVVVLESADPRQIDREVTQYFNTNNIAWETVPAQMQVQLNSNLYNLVDAQTSNAANSVSREQNAQNPQNSQEGQSQLREQIQRRTLQGGISQTAGIQPSVQASVASPASQQSPPAAIDNIYIARKLSRRQAQELSDALGRAPAPRPDATREDQAAANAPQQVTVDAGPIAPSATPFRQSFAYWRSATLLQRNTSNDTAGAAGLSTTPALARKQPPATQPADERRSSAVGGPSRERQAWELAVTPGSPAATQPDTGQGNLSVVSKFATPRPAPRPSAPAVDLPQVHADGPVDVVIVVQTSASAATTAPTSQPEQ